jgi:hypothetical protein
LFAGSRGACWGLDASSSFLTVYGLTESSFLIVYGLTDASSSPPCRDCGVRAQAGHPSQAGLLLCAHPVSRGGAGPSGAGPRRTRQGGALRGVDLQQTAAAAGGGAPLRTWRRNYEHERRHTTARHRCVPSFCFVLWKWWRAGGDAAWACLCARSSG